MGEPLAQAVITEIQRLAAEGVGRNEIARRLRVSAGTVTRHVPAGSFDRKSTATAVKARQVDLAARRTELAALLLDDAARLREQLWQPHIAFAFGGKENTYNEHPLSEPTPADKRALIASAVTALNAHLRLVDHDSDGGLGEARSVLDGFMDAVAQRAAGIRDAT